MSRVKRGVTAHKRRKRILKEAKGYYGARRKQFSTAIEQVHNAWDDAYAHRRAKKRVFRRLWITRIGAAARQCGTNYSKLMASLKAKDVQIDRKILADLAVRDPGGFKAVVDAVQQK